MFTIRPFQPTDAEYEAIVAVHNRAWPDEPAAVSSRKHNDAQWRERDYLFQRFVAAVKGEIMAEGVYLQPFWSYKPGKYDYGYSIDPAYANFQHNGQSIHTLLYNYVLNSLAGRHLTKLCTGTREDQRDHVNFLDENGFVFQMRYPHSELDVTLFDATRFAGAQERVAAQGIEIVTLPELQQRDPNWKQNVYDLLWELEQDVPSPDPPTKWPMEEFERDLQHPCFCADGWFIAVDRGMLVGVSQLGKSLSQPQKMHTWLTGVVRSHRRKGVATAMKLRAIEFARQRGIHAIDTGNEENNPMYELNMVLGFKPKPAWLDYEKQLDDFPTQEHHHVHNPTIQTV